MLIELPCMFSIGCKPILVNQHEGCQWEVQIDEG
jgi:hypothetical protein